MTSITIEDHELPYDTHNLYDITICTNRIQTLLTHSPLLVDNWLAEASERPSITTSNGSMIVGLDVEWRPNMTRQTENPVATIQVCTGKKCLIFQIMHSPLVPQSLRDFMDDPGVVFVGVGIEEDVEKLVVDYGLRVRNALDLRGVAAEKLGVEGLKSVGLKTLGKEVVGVDVEKPKRVRMSRWDSMWLSSDQVKYACIDAFLSFEIGRTLLAPVPVVANDASASATVATV